MTPVREPDALALQVRGASRRLAGRDVLRQVAIEVPRGTLVVLTGPNGAGKSSLLRAVGGRLALDSGSIHIDGLDAAAARAAGRLGVVPQDIALDAHLSVRENLRLWARLAGAPARVVASRIDEGLSWTGLSERAGARVDTLSGGMRRRVNLLAGLLHRPALLLLDEPTVGVDRESRVRFYELVGELRRDGVGVLLSTHELDEAAETSDAVAVMDGGQIVAHGRAPDLVRTFSAADGEVVVVLASDADASAVLRAEGFASPAPREWTRADRPGGTDLRALDARLTGLGVAVSEVRWRRPTLSRAVAIAIARHREMAA